MVSAQARDGFNATWVSVIRRDAPAKKVSLDPPLSFSGTEGRFGKLFG